MCFGDCLVPGQWDPCSEPGSPTTRMTRGRWAWPGSTETLVGTSHKAVVEVSKIANYRRVVAVNHASQSKSTDGSKSGGRQRNVVAVVVAVQL